MIDCIHADVRDISSLTEFIYKSLNDKKFVVTLCIDLKKTYDIVNYYILLEKLCSHGIRGVALDWLRNYLYNRKQCAKTGSEFSLFKTIEIGVPQ